jgi:hypothetical protein
MMASHAAYWEINLANGVLGAAWIQAAGTFVPTTALAIAAGWGVFNWRKQILEQRLVERRVERAEACLVAADDVVKPMRAARSHVVIGDEDMAVAGSMGEAIEKFEERELGRAFEAFRVFHQAYRRASFFLEMPSPDTDIELGGCLSTLEGALRQARYWEKQRQEDRSDRGARDRAAEFRGQFLGLPHDVDTSKTRQPDPIEVRIQAAMDALEDKLMPLMGGKRRPRTPAP